MHGHNVHGVHNLTGEENGVGGYEVARLSGVEQASVVVSQHLVIHYLAFPWLGTCLAHPQH